MTKMKKQVVYKNFNELPESIQLVFNNFIVNGTEGNEFSDKKLKVLQKTHDKNPHMLEILKGYFLAEVNKISFSHNLEHKVEKELLDNSVDFTQEIVKNIIKSPENYPLSDSTKSNIKSMTSDERAEFISEYKNSHEIRTKHHHAKEFIHKMLSDILPALESLAIFAVDILKKTTSKAIETALPNDVGATLSEIVENAGNAVSNNIKSAMDEHIAKELAEKLADDIFSTISSNEITSEIAELTIHGAIDSHSGIDS